MKNQAIKEIDQAKKLRRMYYDDKESQNNK